MDTSSKEPDEFDFDRFIMISCSRMPVVATAVLAGSLPRRSSTFIDAEIG